MPGPRQLSSPTSFLFTLRRPPTPTLFPYTTLFRSLTSTGSCRMNASRTFAACVGPDGIRDQDRKSTRLNSSHVAISYAVFCLKKKTRPDTTRLSSLRICVHTDNDSSQELNSATRAE